MIGQIQAIMPGANTNRDTNRTSDRGVPKDIAALFQAQNKREAEKLAAKLVLTVDTLAAAIHNCGQLGYSHQLKVTKFTPEHLKDAASVFFLKLRSAKAEVGFRLSRGDSVRLSGFCRKVEGRF